MGRKGFLIKLCLVLFIIVFLIFMLIKPKKEEIFIRKISRQEAYKRAMDIINFVWEYEPIKLYRQDIKLPNFLGDEKKIVVGIPYCWGGYISVDISNIKEVKNFKDALYKGYVPGNVLTEGLYKEKTAGLDCSGFVSAVFNLPEKISTKDMEKYFKYINENKIKPMDIYNAEGEHVFIYLKESYDKSGIITLEARHSKDSVDKTVVSYRSYEQIKKGQNGKKFKAMRYKGIIEDGIYIDMDDYEYNNLINKAYEAEFNKVYKGRIDYIEDVDFFKFYAYKDVLLKIYNLSPKVKVLLKNQKEEVLKEINLKGIYFLRLEKGVYYLEFKNLGFEYKNEYEFELK
ncbi:hypothetical protein SAMN05660865_00650 [Caloramator fervidus]|uniref:NlpC/P60 family protein n=1 Tax=Caloramator fervidus TaxID=29344 RepID=A0A1H5TKP0_9CLOT|nr:hypothetical protein [Caloramator fervidus]SEF63333.1 hypothetical protein SAMN05660865_00650 [Caloramator fervidus]